MDGTLLALVIIMIVFFFLLLVIGILGIVNYASPCSPPTCNVDVVAEEHVDVDATPDLIDGVPVRPGLQVLLNGQHDSSQNGVYEVQSVNAPLFRTDTKLQDRMIFVRDGERHGQQILAGDGRRAALSQRALQPTMQETEVPSEQHTMTEKELRQGVLVSTANVLLPDPAVSGLKPSELLLFTLANRSATASIELGHSARWTCHGGAVSVKPAQVAQFLLWRLAGDQGELFCWFPAAA